MASNVRLVPIVAADLPLVAEIHERAWPESALTAFGRETLRRYYRWLTEGPHDAALVGAWLDGELVGFCSAGVFRGAMSGFLRANRAYLALRIATHPQLALTPLVRERLVQGLQITLRYSRFSKKSSARPGGGTTGNFSVLAIATDPTVRGAGAGRALMLEAEARARKLGHTKMTLTVHVDNHRAVKFYEQLGWERVPSAGGTWTGAMAKQLA